MPVASARIAGSAAPFVHDAEPGQSCDNRGAGAQISHPDCGKGRHMGTSKHLGTHVAGTQLRVAAARRAAAVRLNAPWS